MARSNITLLLGSMAGLMGLFLPSAAQAVSEDPSWFIQAGAARIKLAEDAEVAVTDTPIPGSDLDAAARYTPAIELGYFLEPTVAVTLAVGVPVKQPIDGAGTLAPYGRLASITYGPAAAMVQWHPLGARGIDPYVGAGVAYIHVFDQQDGSLQSFDVENDVGPVLQAGLAVDIRQSWALFIDAKKAFLRTDVRGSLGPAPVVGHLRLDPLVLQGGIRLSF